MIQPNKPHENTPGVCCDPVVTLTRVACRQGVRVEAKPYPGARPEVWEGNSETVAIRAAGDMLRDMPGCLNAVLCIEWPADSVGHDEPMMRPQVELRRFWAHVASPRVRGGDVTTADEDSVDSWAPANPWPADVVGPWGVACQCSSCVPVVVSQ